MSDTAKRKCSTTARMKTEYRLELAVGASHVASTLYTTSRHACIEELTASFTARYGHTDVKRFLLALAEKLDARENTEGAQAVRHYAMHGTAPEPIPAPAPAVVTKKGCRG
jgi:hypothetical protein